MHARPQVAYEVLTTALADAKAKGQSEVAMQDVGGTDDEKVRKFTRASVRTFASQCASLQLMKHLYYGLPS